MFSKACEYGIRAMLYIAKNSLRSQRVSLKDIAREVGSPEAFTAKTLQQLVRNKLLQSIKGPYGGFELTQKQLEETSLSQIVETIDGDGIFKTCGLGLSACNASAPCPLHYQFFPIRENLRKTLENAKLIDLAKQLDDGVAFLNLE
ncbi:MAG: Rrf2 family iron-sulfur cluster assembly transcriptional regulator [Arenicella sp.]|jgi:Rrf2 family iron-sulfur cluster assembly transcriptional regulator